MITLLLIILSLCIMVTRYSLEYTFNISHTHASPAHVPYNISMNVTIPVIVISDLLPIIAHLLLIWMANKGQTDYLVCGYLHTAADGDVTTYAGSVMFDELYQNQTSADGSV